MTNLELDTPIKAADEITESLQASVAQESFARALATVVRAVDSRPTLPVLSNVLIQATDSSLVLTATNLETTITTEIDATIKKMGAITVPAKTLHEYVSKLMPERIDLRVNPSNLTLQLKCGTTRTSMHGINASEYPASPPVRDPDITLPAQVLKTALEQVAFARALEINRPVLMGVYFSFEGSRIRLASADGFRLALREIQLAEPLPDNLAPIVVPGQAIQSIIRLIGTEDTEVGIALPDKLKPDRVMFRTGGKTYIHSLLLEGHFPDFDAIVPKTYSTRIEAYRSDLIRAIQRAEVFARDSAHAMRFLTRPSENENVPGQLVVIGRSAERGEAEGEIDIALHGEPLEIAFNSAYIRQGLDEMLTERVSLEANGPSSPGVFKQIDDDDYLYVVMPMSIKH